MSNVYKELAQIIESSNNIVFFGGAGVSTECGLPDFRSKNGLYNKKNKYKYPPEKILSHSFFIKNPDIFYEYARENLFAEGILPNKGHKALADLESLGKVKAVITQNIDGLHQMAKSKNVLELHGSILNYYCMKCGKKYNIDYVKSSNGVPLCECGGIIRPDVVLYEESLDEMVLAKSLEYIRNAEVLIVAGTSLRVYPAAGLIRYFKGKKLVIINQDSTPYDNAADLVINKPFAKTMMKVMVEMGLWKFKSRIVENDIENYIPHPNFQGVELYPFLSSDENLGIRSQYVRIQPGGEIMPHTHDVVEVFVILKGNPHVLIDGDWLQIEPNTTTIAYPGEVHGVKNNTDEEILLMASFKC